MRYVALDVACLECDCHGDNATRVLGIYDTREEAEAQRERSRYATETLWASYDFQVAEAA